MASAPQIEAAGTAPTVRCGLCGCAYDPAESASCVSCPLHGGCGLVCCPACGLSTIDPSSSSLVSLGTRARRRLAGRRGRALRTEGLA